MYAMKENTFSRIACTAASALLFSLTALSSSATMIDTSAFSSTFGIQFTGYTGSSTLTDFPVLVKLSEAKGFRYGKCNIIDGEPDIRFALADGTLLSHQIDTWNTSGVSYVWVKIPAFNATTGIKAYYGCSGTPPAVSGEDVWSNGYVGVWHLGESALPLEEASGTQMSFTEKFGTVAFGASGAIGGALDMSGGAWAARVQAAHDDRLSGFTNCTFEVWTKQDAFNTANNRGIFNKRDNYTVDISYYMYQNYQKGGAISFQLSTNGTTQASWTGNTVLQKTGVWTHVAGVFEANKARFRIFLDGEGVYSGSLGEYTSNPIWTGSSPLQLGGSHLANAFPGQLDEFRISRTARSDDWLKASHDCVAEEGFCTYSFDADWEDYTYRFTVTFTTGITGTLENFPVLVRIAEYDETTGTGIEGFRYADCQLPMGGDLRFSLPNETAVLSCEVDTWNTNGESLVWVKVPVLSPSTKIVCYYGCVAPHGVKPYDVWSEGFAGVWHLGSTDKLIQPDSTVNGHSFVCHQKDAAHVDLAAVGVAGGAIGFCKDNTNYGGLYAADTDGGLSGFMDVTIEAWLCPTNVPSANRGILVKRSWASPASSYYSYQMYVNTSGKTQATICSAGKNATEYPGASDYAPELGKWSHVAMKRTGTDGIILWFQNGVPSASTRSTTAGALCANTTIPLVVGNDSASFIDYAETRYINTTSAYPGSIDEVRISSVARSEAWVKASHDTVANADFATYSPAKKTTRAMVLFFR